MKINNISLDVIFYFNLNFLYFKLILNYKYKTLF